MKDELIDTIKSNKENTPLLKLIALGVVVYALIISSTYVFQFTFGQLVLFTGIPSVVIFSLIELSTILFAGILTYLLFYNLAKKDLSNWTVIVKQFTYFIVAFVIMQGLAKVLPMYLPDLLFGDSHTEITKYYTETSASDVFNIIESIDYYLKIGLIFVISIMKK